MFRRHICLSRLESLILSFSCNFFAYFKFHRNLGRVIGKIKQNELDCRDTAPLKLYHSRDSDRGFVSGIKGFRQADTEMYIISLVEKFQNANLLETRTHQNKYI